MLWLCGAPPGLRAQTAEEGLPTARPLITQAIDGTRLVALPGNVRPELIAGRDLGPVEDGLQLHLYLVLRRSAEQQAALDRLIARQQQPAAPEYHRWLTPREFGERFGASRQDIEKVSAWLESQGLRVTGVMNNASFISFSATAGQIRATFHTEMHYCNVQSGKYAANAQDPMIPAALEPVVAGIEGLSRIPPRGHHTRIHPVAYDAAAHQWHNADSAYATGGGGYLLTPQDFYTIYNVDKVFNSGNLGANRTIAVAEISDMHYGTVNATTGAASGGDVATFRGRFGVPGTLNMHVYHGYGTVTCADPGVADDDNESEAALDAEWANALAPSANLIFMSCGGGSLFTALAALVDNSLADAIGNSYGASEQSFVASDFSAFDTLNSEASLNGQTIFVAAGDAGSDDNDQNTSGTATSGVNIDALSASSLVTAAGGTDFSDLYDASMGGPPQSRYWGATNSLYFGNAWSYVPETAWNDSCASSLLAKWQGADSPAVYCALGPSSNGHIDGAVIGGGGGYSTHYAQPSYQSGTPGLSGSATWRATPDISLFAANGVLGHYLIMCDSSAASTACTSTSTFGGGGGTSFVAPQLTGIAALLAGYTGSRQGPWNPTLYALAKAQYTASATSSSCYSNGQTSNTGVTAGLPASGCIFNDVTTGNNDVPCAAGATGCFVDSGAEYGLLSTTGASLLTVAFPAGPGYDLATGLGSINVYNLIAGWSTALAGEAQTISFGALSSRAFGTASFTVGAAASSGLPVSFASETTPVCTVSGSTVTLAAVGICTIQATQSGNGTYAAATPVTQSFQVTQASQTISFGALSKKTVGAAPFTVGATASSGLAVSFASTTTPVCTVSGATVTLVAAGTCTIQATQAGNADYAAALPADQSFAVMANPLQLVPVAPCRVIDTRNADGPLGGPYIAGGSTRAIPIPS
ncbi:MAG: protease pro-enzyme activation domain-containing protein, partial [Bryobacteraceae bacterium]